MAEFSMNRAACARNPYQGNVKKVLCLCSAGLLRSPTAANVIHQEFGFNTRAAGLSDDYSLVPCDEVLTIWADEVVLMTAEHEAEFRRKFPTFIGPVYRLDLPDHFRWNDPELRTLIAQKYKAMMDRECTIVRDMYGRDVTENYVPPPLPPPVE